MMATAPVVAACAMLVLVLVSAPAASAIRILLSSKRTECFSETAEGASAEVDLKFRWEIMEPQRYDDAIVTMESPGRIEVYNSGVSQYGHYEARAIEDGAYRVCFRLAPASAAYSTTPFSVQFFWDVLQRGTQLYAHEVTANTVLAVQGTHTPVKWTGAATDTQLRIAPSPALQVAALRFDLSALVPYESLSELRETSITAAVRLHVANADVPNAQCRVVSPRPSNKHSPDPLRSVEKDKANAQRTFRNAAAWATYAWTEGGAVTPAAPAAAVAGGAAATPAAAAPVDANALTWSDLPVGLTLLDSQPCHTNRTIELSITDEFMHALDMLNHTHAAHQTVATHHADSPTAHTAERLAALETAVATGLQLTVFVVTDAASVSFHSRHSSNPTGVRPQLLIQVSDDSLTSAVHELSANVFRLKTSQTYTRIRERVLRDTTESTNSRTQWFSVMLCGFLAAVSALQILYLKTLLEPKSSLDAYQRAPQLMHQVNANASLAAAATGGLHSAPPITGTSRTI